MEKDIFIRHLDYVYGLVSEEYELCKSGNGSYDIRHLRMILKELRSMKYRLNHREFSPYYPRGIIDDWKQNDTLGIQLLQLADEYRKL